VPPSDAARVGAPLIAAAGDIACPPWSGFYHAGAGTLRACGQERTADLIRRGGYSAVLALGDLQYNRGRLALFKKVYGGTWGRFKAKTYPTAGNHEYVTSGARGYFDYFNGDGGRLGRAGERPYGWYSFELGSWHIVSLNSNCSIVRCGGSSRQQRWLRRNLAQHRARCTLAFFHHPRFSSLHHDREGRENVRPLWRTLYRAGADVVLNGHEHVYERFAPQGSRGEVDRRRGIVEMVVGTGGHSLYPSTRLRRNSEAFQNTTFGILAMRLGRGHFAWRYLAAPGGQVLDRGDHACHGPPPRWHRLRYR
jgi:Calcineurin-like phosphoesterase